MPMGNVPADNAASRGARLKDSKGTPPSRLFRWLPQWWVIFLILLMANQVLIRVFFPEPSSITIPYTFFKKQVEAGNIRDVTQCGRFDSG